MLLINWTKGFSQTYWRPKFYGRTDKDGLWYFEVRILRVQVAIYSRELGGKFLDQVRKKICGPQDTMIPSSTRV